MISTFHRRLAASAAWVALYLAIGGMLASIIARHHAPFCLFCANLDQPPNCFPETGLFGAIQTNCAEPAFDIAWFLLIGIARSAIIPIGITVLILADLKGNYQNIWNWIDLAAFAVASIPSAALFISAFRFWRVRRPWLGAGIAGLTILNVSTYVMSNW